MFLEARIEWPLISHERGVLRKGKVDRGNSGSNVLDGISIWPSTWEEGDEKDGTAGRYEADCVPGADPESSSFFSRALGRRVTTLNRHRAND